MTEGPSGPSAPTVEAKVKALEELRTADRLLLGAQGMLQHLCAQQVLDLAGVRNNESLFGENERREVGRANEDLLEAQACVRQALAQLGAEPGGDIAELKQWGYTEWALDGPLFDFLAARKAAFNLSVVDTTRGQVRQLFASIHRSDGELQKLVEPLAVEEKDDLLDQADQVVGVVSGVNPRFWTPVHWVIFVGGAVVFAIAAVVGVLGFFSSH